MTGVVGLVAGCLVKGRVEVGAPASELGEDVVGRGGCVFGDIA